MVDSRKSPTIPVAEPIALSDLIDKKGIQFVSELSGYTVTSIRQMVKGTKPCRQAIETLCQLYLDNQQSKEEKAANQESIFFFAGADSSTEMVAIKALFTALNVNLQKL